MTDLLTITAVVTRTELSLADLSLDVPGDYLLTRVAAGGRQWDRQTVSSRYAHGEYKAGPSTLRHGSLGLGVRCYSSSAAGLESKVVAMVNAFSQGLYLLTVTIDGVQHRWSCWEADIDVVGGDLEKFGLASHQQEYALTVPRAPIALLGAL